LVLQRGLKGESLLMFYRQRESDLCTDHAQAKATVKKEMILTIRDGGRDSAISLYFNELPSGSKKITTPCTIGEGVVVAVYLK